MEGMNALRGFGDHGAMIKIPLRCAAPAQPNKRASLSKRSAAEAATSNPTFCPV